MTRHHWTDEELEAREQFLRAAAFVVLIGFAAVWFGLALVLLLIRGSFSGWLCLCVSVVFGFAALDVGLDLEDR